MPVGKRTCVQLIIVLRCEGFSLWISPKVLPNNTHLRTKFGSFVNASFKVFCFSRRCKKASAALPIVNAKSFYIVVIDCPLSRSLMHSNWEIISWSQIRSLCKLNYFYWDGICSWTHLTSLTPALSTSKASICIVWKVSLFPSTSMSTNIFCLEIKIKTKIIKQKFKNTELLGCQIHTFYECLEDRQAQNSMHWM